MNARSNIECWTTLSFYGIVDGAYVSYHSYWAVRVVETKEEYFVILFHSVVSWQKKIDLRT